MDVYLITVDDHQKSMKKYYICVTKSAADMLFQKIVKTYFDPKKDTKEDFDACKQHMFWESQNGDIITCLKYHALTEEEIKDNKILSLFAECMIK